jgi:transposase
VKANNLYRWYKESLSGFRDTQTQTALHQHDFTTLNSKGKPKTIAVPIYEPLNMGKDMAIDETQLGGEMHTILTNRETGKIALLARSIRVVDLERLLPQDDSLCRSVECITRDLSPTYRQLCNNSFLCAYHVADKFHVIRLLMEAMQDVRIRFRQDALKERRVAYERYKREEKSRQQQAKSNGTQYQKHNFIYQEEKLDNGETVLEALARSKYLLYKNIKDWKDSEAKRAKAIFKKYPEIEKSYSLANKFRQWYSKDNIRVSSNIQKTELNIWIKEVEQADVEEMLNFKSTVERNKEDILRYFIKGQTNAIAENINSRIKRIVSPKDNRDMDFAYFKIKKLFAQPEIKMVNNKCA